MREIDPQHRRRGRGGQHDRRPDQQRDPPCLDAKAR